jgi:hypothetical protein
MQSSSNRSIVVISGLLTLLLLSGGALALGFHNGWLHAGSGAAIPATVSAASQPGDGRSERRAPIEPTPPPAGSTQTATQDETAVYRQKLDDAYRALDDAYAQIRALQAPQLRLASIEDGDGRSTSHDGDDEHRERRPRRRDSDGR